MWMDFYVKAQDKATFEAALPVGGFGTDVVLDVMGDLSVPEVRDEEGTLLQAAHNVAGWHVNVRCLNGLPPSLEAFVIDEPMNPKRYFM